MRRAHLVELSLSMLVYGALGAYLILGKKKV